MKFSTGRVNAFYTADQQERESIRQDVLVERYADLQMEMENIETLLNISEQERDESLYEINELLFDIIETLVPEINDDIENNVINEEVPNSVEANKEARVQRIKQREKDAINVAKNAEQLKRARSSIKTAQLKIKGAGDPPAKAKAREALRNARKTLSTATIKASDKK